MALSLTRCITRPQVPIAAQLKCAELTKMVDHLHVTFHSITDWNRLNNLSPLSRSFAVPQSSDSGHFGGGHPDTTLLFALSLS